MLIVSDQKMYFVNNHFYIHLINNYTEHLSTKYVPGIILVNGNTAVHKTVI